MGEIRSVRDLSGAYSDGLVEGTSIDVESNEMLLGFVKKYYLIERDETIAIDEFADRFYVEISSELGYTWVGDFNEIEVIYESGVPLWDIPFEDCALTNKMARAIKRFREVELFVVENRIIEFKY